MPFVPNSDLFICKVPWDSTYKHVRLYNTSADQEADIKTLSVYPSSFVEYTYIRWNHSIRVGNVNPEQLQYANYVMYKNMNTPNARWVYAFIAQCNYLNDKVAELVLETDVWQTYMFYVDFTSKQYIERQHISAELDLFTNSSLIAPEDDIAASYGLWEYETDDLVVTDFYPDKIIIATTADVSYLDNAGISQTLPQKRVDVYGCLMNYIPSGASFYAFNRAPYGEVGAYQMMRDLNIVGAGNAIADIFLFPSAFLPSTGTSTNGGMNGAYANFRLDSNNEHPRKTYTITRPTQYGSNQYHPHNQKCFTYPYSFLRVQADTGEYVDYKWENFLALQEGGNTVDFNASVQVSPDAQAVVWPRRYLGIDNATEHALMFPATIKCTWTYGSYANWAAQNRLGNVMRGIAGAAMLAVPAGRGVKAALSSLSARRAISEGSRYSVGELGKSLAAYDSVSKPSRAFMQSLANDSMVMGAGASMLGSLASDVFTAAQQPDKMTGNGSPADIYNALGNKYVRFKSMHLRGIRQIDDFFTVYGYAHNYIREVNMTGRQFWNYVKLVNCSFKGLDIPDYALRLIRQSFDNGVFLWHTTSEFGYLKLNNPSVSNP